MSKKIREREHNWYRDMQTCCDFKIEIQIKCMSCYNFHKVCWAGLPITVYSWKIQQNIDLIKSIASHIITISATLTILKQYHFIFKTVYRITELHNPMIQYTILIIILESETRSIYTSKGQRKKKFMRITGGKKDKTAFQEFRKERNQQKKDRLK